MPRTRFSVASGLQQLLTLRNIVRHRYLIAQIMQNVKIDNAGRIVLPKPVRERFQLRAGTNLELEKRSEGLVLRPTGQRPSIVQKKGV